MGKKKSNATAYVSKGIHSNVANSTMRLVRADYLASGDRLINQRAAFDAGKNVMVTIPNPNVSETHKPYLRVNAKTIWKTATKK
jgi:hypothetical protein